MDRWLTLSVVAPLAQVWRAPAQPAIPILMYHSIADDIDDAVHPYFRTVTTPANFARQIALLQRQGYQAVTLSEALQTLDDPAGLSAGARKVVLTFDDGFRDFLTAAHPILERAGCKATVFLSTAFLGGRFPTGRACLHAAQVRALSEAGIEFGSHSVSHRRLVELPPAELEEELRSSKRAIEDIIGKEAPLFSYPFRFPQENHPFTRRLAELLAASGYRAGVTTTLGRARPGDEPWFLPRLPVNDCDDAVLLKAKLEGHYDWVGVGQAMRKKSRAFARRWMRS